MVSNPLLLYQLLVFIMECIFKAHAETMLEMLESDEKKMEGKEWLISKFFFFFFEGKNSTNKYFKYNQFFVCLFVFFID